MRHSKFPCAGTDKVLRTESEYLKRYKEVIGQVVYYKKSTTPVLSFCLLGRCLPKLLQGYPKSVICLPPPLWKASFCAMEMRLWRLWNPLVPQLSSQRLIGMVCTRNPGIMEGAGGQYPEKTAHILKKVFLLHRPLVIDMKMFYY